MFSYLIHTLQQYNVTDQTLSFILIIMIILVIACFCRQVIWLTGYAIVYPLIIALIRHIYGMMFAITLVWWLIASLLTTLILKAIFVLEWAKYSIMVCIYLIILMIITILTPWLTSKFLTIPILTGQMVSIFIIQNILWDVSKISFSTLQVLTHSMIIAWCYYLLLQWSRLQWFVLIYPDIVILMSIVCIIMIGRYTWLQAIEVIRFYPLIKNYFAQDEEE